jgi:hypothetical protein
LFLSFNYGKEKKERALSRKEAPLKVSTKNGRLKACFDAVELIFVKNGLKLDVNCFRADVKSTPLACDVRNGGLKHLPIYYFRAFNYVYYRFLFYFGKKAAERFYLDAILAFSLDMRDADFNNEFDKKRKPKSTTESKNKAPRQEATNIILQEVREALAAERAKVSNNKNVTSNVLKTNVLKAENAEKRREEMLDLLRNNPTETYESLAAIFGCTSKTISRDIKRLEASGRLRRIGEKSTGHWEVTE